MTINCKDSKIELVNRKIVLFSVYFQLKLKYIKKRGEKLEKDEILLYVIIAGIIAAVIGAGIGYLLRRRIAEARIGSAEEKAAQLVASAEKERENALREAETLKKKRLYKPEKNFINSVKR